MRGVSGLPDDEAQALADLAALLEVSGALEAGQPVPIHEIGGEARPDSQPIPPIACEVRAGHVRSLSACRAGLTRVPDSLGALTALDAHNLGENELAVLPDVIGRLGNLRGLFLHNNQLRSVPAAIGALRRLRVLDLGHNAIETIADEIGDLASLRFLYLSDNQIDELPASIGKLAGLR